MNLQQIQGELRNYAKVNLSKARIEQYATRLQSKLTEESTQEELIELIKDLDALVDFKQVAKDDDRFNTFKTQQEHKNEMKPQQTDEPKKDDTPEWAKALQAEIQSLKAEKLQDTIKSTVHERLKDVPKEILDFVKLPSSLDEVDDFVDKFSNSFKEAKIQTRINSFGNDNPKPSDNKQVTQGVKEKTAEEIKAMKIKF